MSTDKHPVVDKLHEVFSDKGLPAWKSLTETQQAAIKTAAETITQLTEQLNTPQPAELDPPRFGEARCVAFTSEKGQLLLPVKEGESAGILWEVTVRGDDLGQLAAMVKQAQAVFIANGFVAKDTYLDQRRNERVAGLTVTNTATGAVVSAPAPVSQGANKGDYLIVKCKELSPGPKSDKDSSPIWKVLTDKSKYPVPFWDLEDEGVNRLDDQRAYLAQNGININEMYTNTKPPKPVVIDMTGWVAYCTQSDKGYPSKVVKLEKVG